jgi:3',5'-cyclic-nucleotide phosphodiesterase
VLLTHTHLDHVAELGTVADLRTQEDAGPLVVAGLPETVAALREHFFNWVLWPDFTAIPEEEPSIRLVEVAPGKPAAFGDVEVLPVPVHHSVPSCGYVVRIGGGRSFAFSGDTGPTDAFWRAAAEAPDLGGVLTEVSFPDHLEELALRTGHLTPALVERELAKLRNAGADAPVWLYGSKPSYEEAIAGELERLEPDAFPVHTDQTIEL